jgi:hypothetical protein
LTRGCKDHYYLHLDAESGSEGRAEPDGRDLGRRELKEHAACIKERTSSTTKDEEDKQIDIETMRGIMEDRNDGLKGTLRTVLSDEEYKGFLDSLPPAPSAPPEVPAVPNPPK